jgi:hypothetical protein
MSDMRTMATAVEAYAVDNNFYPNAQCTGKFTAITTVMNDSSLSVLSPTYIANPVRRDGWSKFMLYNTQGNNQEYGFKSFGRDNTVQASPVCITTTNFNDDIIYANGGFIQWPEGSQN